MVRASTSLRLAGTDERICRPVIEEANHLGPTFARLFKETIILAKPSKPFPRAAKGTTQRKQALALYAEEIEQLYVE